MERLKAKGEPTPGYDAKPTLRADAYLPARIYTDLRRAAPPGLSGPPGVSPREFQAWCDIHRVDAESREFLWATVSRIDVAERNRAKEGESDGDGSAATD